MSQRRKLKVLELSMCGYVWEEDPIGVLQPFPMEMWNTEDVQGAAHIFHNAQHILSNMLQDQLDEVLVPDERTSKGRPSHEENAKTET